MTVRDSILTLSGVQLWCSGYFWYCFIWEGIWLGEEVCLFEAVVGRGVQLHEPQTNDCLIKHLNNHIRI